MSKSISKSRLLHFLPILIFATVLTALLIYPLSLFSRTSPNPDFDGSGVVDFPDFLRFVGAFGSSQGEEKYEIKYDLDSNGEIAFDDFLIFVSSFGKAVKPRAAKRVVSTSDVTAVCDRTVRKCATRLWRRFQVSVLAAM